MFYTLLSFFIEYCGFLLLLAITSPLLGKYLANLYKLNRVWVLEKGIYSLAKINPYEEMDWKEYLKNLLIFNFIGFSVLFLILMFQGILPLNPQQFKGLDWSLALNVAISFVTNTNWQSYAGETTLSYFSQTLGLTVQNFLSPASGIAALFVLIRGVTIKQGKTLGNFWVDITRIVLYVLLPLSLIFSLFLISQGSIQNFHSYQVIKTLEGETQTIPMGPVASMVAIKQLGSNGGGFFNTNSAHPFENPTCWTSFFQLFAILWIPLAIVYMYGLIISSKKEAFYLFLVMFFLFLSTLTIATVATHARNPIMEAYPNYEGVEIRNGIGNTVLWAIATTATSNGSINAMHDSLMPLAGGAALFNMMIGEIIFGGVGSGLISMLMYVFLTVFLAGLMVGRTPEYLGKKMEKMEIKWVMLAILAPCGLALLGASLALLHPNISDYLKNKGPHGLTEILYAYISAAGNNGSAFAGFDANTTYFNVTLSIVMLLSRLSILIPSIAIGGCLVEKKFIPKSLGTFPTKSLLFAILLFFVILIIAALTFFPAFALGPIMEHILMLRKQTF